MSVKRIYEMFVTSPHIKTCVDNFNDSDITYRFSNGFSYRGNGMPNTGYYELNHGVSPDGFFVSIDHDVSLISDENILKIKIKEEEKIIFADANPHIEEINNFLYMARFLALNFMAFEEYMKNNFTEEDSPIFIKWKKEPQIKCSWEDGQSFKSGYFHKVNNIGSYRHVLKRPSRHFDSVRFTLKVLNIDVGKKIHGFIPSKNLSLGKITSGIKIYKNNDFVVKKIFIYGADVNIIHEEILEILEHVEKYNKNMQLSDIPSEAYSLYLGDIFSGKIKNTKSVKSSEIKF